MNGTSTPSFAGPARRSRRLQGTPSGTSAGHVGSATAASGSPYARRPALKRDSSSQTLAALESGADARLDARELERINRRKSVGHDGLLGRFKRGLGWLVGRSTEAASTEDGIVEERESADGANDVERAMTATTRPPARQRPAIPSASTSNTLHDKHITQQLASASTPASQYAFRPPPSIASNDADAPLQASKKLRTSHSTLNLPVSPPRSVRQAHASAGPMSGRGLSPQRALSPGRRLLDSRELVASSSRASNVFQAAPRASTSSLQVNGLPGVSSSRRSMSPGSASQVAFAQPTSATSSTFGLQSQSPFRSGGHSARSPDLSALNISSGLARSPSLPRHSLGSASRPASRLYPYQRGPSMLSGLPRSGTLPVFPSSSAGNAGVKRGFGSIAGSPPRFSPGLGHRQTPHISPTSTDFGSDFSHRAKRQRLNVVWHPEQGFVPTDLDGNPLNSEPAQREEPMNDADRILARLEATRRPQVERLRRPNPPGINVPVPSTGHDSSSIFATRITASQTAPSLGGQAISPFARRQQAIRDERIYRRERVNARGGLGEHLRLERIESDRHSPAIVNGPSGDDSEEESVMSHTYQGSEAGADEAVENIANHLPKPVERRNRQRTRELSVMSDDNAVGDDTPMSLRRSGRLAKSVRKTSPPRERKSAKSPPPSRKTRFASPKDGRDEDTAARSPSPPTARSRPSQSREGAMTRRRAASPLPDEGRASIDQVMSPERPAVPQNGDGTPASPTAKGRSSREERLSRVSARRPGAFSAKDESEDLLANDSTLASGPPKLKLPASVFANRFSFGRSPSSANITEPNSTMLANGQSSTVNASMGSSSDPTQASSAAALPKLALPSSLAGQHANTTNKGQPSNTLQNAQSASLFSTNTTNVAQSPHTVGPMTDKVTPKPMFDFKAPASHTPTTAEAVSTKPAFTLKSSTVPPASESTTKAHSFSFGSAKEESTSKSAPATSSGQSSASSAPKVSTFWSSPGKYSRLSTIAAQAPVFSFGATSSSTATQPDTNTTKSTPASEPSETSVSSAPAPKAPTFSFAQPQQQPKFAFGAAAPTATAASAELPKSTAPSASAPAFSFGAATPTTSKTTGTNDAHASDKMQDSPPAAKQSDKPATPALFSPVIQPSKPPAFSFGQPSATATSSSTTAPSFNFGQNKPENENKSRSASPFAPPSTAASQGSAFGVKANAQPTFTGFGAAPSGSASTEAQSAPAFNFGAPAANASGSVSPAGAPSTTNPFAFGQAAPKSSNPFGNVSNAFGGSAANAASTSSASTPAPAFSFGAPQTTSSTANAAPFGGFGQATAPPSASTPAFSFGAGASSAAPGSFGSSGGGPPTPSFTFGGGSTPAGIAASSHSAAPAFSFGGAAAPATQPSSPAGTPTGIEGQGGFFSVGSGDGSTSPNKGRRPIKPLRQRRAG